MDLDDDFEDEILGGFDLGVSDESSHNTSSPMDSDESSDDTSLGLNDLVSLAAKTGDIVKLQELLQEGHPTKDINKQGWRPLHIAAARGHVECVRLLLAADDAEVDALTKDSRPVTALQLACQTKPDHTEVVKLLLNAGADPNMKAVTEWELPLPEAVFRNNIDTVKVLLKAGADPNRADFERGVPLHVAAEHCSSEIAEVLLENGAEVDWKDELSQTALHKLLLSEVHEDFPLPFMNLLIEKGCDVNARMRDGTSPLMLAVQNSWEALIMRLLECGANPNNMKDNGMMALHLAIESGPDIQKSKDYRGKPKDQDEQSRIFRKIFDLTERFLIIPWTSQPIRYSIFHLAVLHNKINTINMLIARGLAPDMFIQKVDDPILLAMVLGNQVCKLPFEVNLGVEVNTPLAALLSRPINKTRVKMAKYMVDEGSDVNAVTPECIPPLVAAVNHQFTSYEQSWPGYDIIEYLLEKGVDVLYKIRERSVLPAALHVSSLYNVNAFALLLRCIPAQKIYTRNTIEGVSQHYSSSLYYFVDALFPWRVISWLSVLNLFVPQLPLDIKGLFDIKRKVNDDNMTNAWNTLDADVGSPKTLDQLCVLTVRQVVGERRGWAQLSSSLENLKLNDASLPRIIMDNLQFKQVETVSLIKCPPPSSSSLYPPVDPLSQYRLSF